jgi:hypothetical protein
MLDGSSLISLVISAIARAGCLPEVLQDGDVGCAQWKRYSDKVTSALSHVSVIPRRKQRNHLKHVISKRLHADMRKASDAMSSRAFR